MANAGGREARDKMRTVTIAGTSAQDFIGVVGTVVAVVVMVVMMAIAMRIPPSSKDEK